MPENDITKMKVADLKRELKLRGLATTGNKIELQDRLQTALIDGELLEDAAMSGEEELLTDEEEAKILGADENELLKSPTTTPTVPELTTAGNAVTSGGTHEDALLESPTTPTAPGKKIVLKRKNSFTTNVSNTTSTTNESTDPTEGKVIKMSERHPIIINVGNAAINKSEDQNKSSNETKKLSQLSLQERLDLRAKKFGVSANVPAKTDSTSAKTTEVGDEKQIELLKKRAERFGCVVSSKMVKLDAQEKLLKRKERFGGADNTVTNTTGTKSSAPVSSDVWAEKARLRLERFKSAPNSTSTVTVKSNASATVAGAD